MKVFFVGNRNFVLKELLKSKLSVCHVGIIKESHLVKDKASLDCDSSIISNKSELIDLIYQLDFDIFLSNGCPYILPMKQLSKDLPDKKFINIHPSYLPDLRGVDPVLGMVFHERDGGATCHFMNDVIDGGDIIARVKIPYSCDLDVSLGYQLSFFAECEVFKMALKSNFENKIEQEEKNDLIYFTRKDDHRTLFRSDSFELLERKVKTFSNRNQGAVAKVGEEKIHFHLIEKMNNSYLIEKIKEFDEYTVFLKYENSIIYRDSKNIIKLVSLCDNLQEINVGDKVFE